MCTETWVGADIIGQLRRVEVVVDVVNASLEIAWQATKGGKLDLVDMMTTIWRSKWIVLITVVVTVGLVAFQSSRQQIIYQAEAILVVGDLGLGQLNPALRRQDEDKLADSYRELLMTGDVLQRAINDAGLNITPAQLRSRITASTTKDSPYIKLSAVDYSVESAVGDVNAAANGLTAHLIEQQLKISAEGKQNVLSEMTKVENELIAVGNSQIRDSGRISALQTVRQSLIKEYEGFVLSTNSPMLNVVSLADSATVNARHAVRNSMLGLVVGAIAGMGIGFVADSMKKAIKREGSRDA